MRICIYGSGRDRIDEVYKKAAFDLGSSIARRGYSMVFGGGARGVMGAAARGAAAGCAAKAAAAGGAVRADSDAAAGIQKTEILGIAPGDLNVDEEECSYCTRWIRTSNMAERKRAFIENSDAFVVMPGGFGTYDEFFDLMVARKLPAYFEGDEARCQACSRAPLAIYNVNGYFDPLYELLEHLIREDFAADWHRDLYRFCTTEDELWRYLEGSFYPEECCDAGEITGDQFAEWSAAADGGFWKHLHKTNT